MKFSIIGTSGITENFLNAAKQHKDFELVAVYSRSIEKAEEFGKKYGAKLFFDSIEEMAKCNEVEAVYIASPNAFHARQALICLNNGKHVMCEKPMASNSFEVSEMIKAAENNNVVLMEAMKPVLTPTFKAILHNIDKIGKIRRYFASYCQYSSRYDKYKEGIVLNAFKRELSNGAIMDIGVYTIYPMVVLFGEPEEIRCNAIMLESGVDGEGSAIFKYNNDFLGVVQYSKISNSYLPCEIQGEEGSILIDRINCPKKAIIKYRDGREEDISVNQDCDDMYYEVDEFISLIKDGKKQSEINSHKNSLATSKIMEECRKQIGLKFDSDR